MRVDAVRAGDKTSGFGAFHVFSRSCMGVHEERFALLWEKLGSGRSGACSQKFYLLDVSFEGVGECVVG